MATCSVRNCSKHADAHGMCGMHNQRMNRHGDTETTLRNNRPSGQTPEEAFRWFMPEEPPFVAGLPPEEQPCWDWRGPLNTTGGGYGIIRFNTQKRVLAHRVSHDIFVGPVGMFNVLHSCDRPICVQPLHLRVGTQSDNVRDAVERDRWVPAAAHSRGEEHGLAKLTESDVRIILSRPLPQRELAARFGISRSTVQQIQSGKTWRHVR